LILKETWIWQVLGQHRINNNKVVFNIAITDIQSAEYYITRQLYYLGYDLIKEDNKSYVYVPYNPHDLSWLDSM